MFVKFFNLLLLVLLTWRDELEAVEHGRKVRVLIVRERTLRPHQFDHVGFALVDRGVDYRLEDLALCVLQGGCATAPAIAADGWIGWTRAESCRWLGTALVGDFLQISSEQRICRGAARGELHRSIDGRVGTAKHEALVAGVLCAPALLVDFNLKAFLGTLGTAPEKT